MEGGAAFLARTLRPRLWSAGRGLALPGDPPIPAARPRSRRRSRASGRRRRGSLWLCFGLLVSLPALAFVAFLNLAGPVAALSIGPVDKVLVDKSARKLWLMRDGDKLFEADISLGRNPQGRKQREGDQRTPEGKYSLTWRDPDSDHHRAILISYPNQADLARARSHHVDAGGGIMIHGQKYFWRWFSKSPLTNGCIGVSNLAMDVIWSSVQGNVPIEIRP
jgi:hypothetical protein